MFFSGSQARGYEIYYMLNTARKYKNIEKFSFFLAQISLERNFSCP